ncbi:HAMP domain-containing histidine kinase [Ruminococcaceae bacterium OttesenSCG-928-I18]|nr:HAMP domain-containing histidine kinase [Ruminococcaceae bacterium OttesenSCG-928-I18]
MSKSIRYYYFTTIATVLVTSVMVMGLIQIGLAVNYFQQDKEEQLEKVVQGVVNGALTGQITLTDESRFTIDFMGNMVDAGVYITDPAGYVVYTTEKAASMLGSQISGKVLQAAYEQGVYRELGLLGGTFTTNFYTVCQPILGANGSATGFVFASSDAYALRVYLSDMASSFVLSSGLVMLLASVLAIVLTNRTVIPIRRVSEAARQFAEGNYSARVPVEGDDELAKLSITFNEMANSFEATDLTRRSFMGNIAHELRTPMTTIKGFIDGMLDGTIPPEQRDKYLAIVSEETGRLARLTQNMLDISKLEAGEYVPDTKDFDIWSPLTSVFLSAEQRLDEKKIEVVGLEPEKPVVVMGDEDFVHQVLFNLLDNAVKFTDDGGRIEVDVEPGKGFVTVGIRNTGEGIPEEVLSHVFDRFYKADESRGTNVGGSGLGLHICKVLLGLMGGRIWAESNREEAWTKFSFTLPLAPQKRRGGLEMI